MTLMQFQNIIISIALSIPVCPLCVFRLFSVPVQQELSGNSAVSTCGLPDLQPQRQQSLLVRVKAGFYKERKSYKWL